MVEPEIDTQPRVADQSRPPLHGAEPTVRFPGGADHVGRAVAQHIVGFVRAERLSPAETEEVGVVADKCPTYLFEPADQIRGDRLQDFPAVRYRSRTSFPGRLQAAEEEQSRER